MKIQIIMKMVRGDVQISSRKMALILIRSYLLGPGTLVAAENTEDSNEDEEIPRKRARVGRKSNNEDPDYNEIGKEIPLLNLCG